jgi:hypothetical protein
MTPSAPAFENRTHGAEKIGPCRYSDFFNTIGEKRTFSIHSQSSCLKRSVRRLLGVGLCHLAYQLGPIHIHRAIDRTGLGPTVVFENFDHQRRVVR